MSSCVCSVMMLLTNNFFLHDVIANLEKLQFSHLFVLSFGPCMRKIGQTFCMLDACIHSNHCCLSLLE